MTVEETTRKLHHLCLMAIKWHWDSVIIDPKELIRVLEICLKALNGKEKDKAG